MRHLVIVLSVKHKFMQRQDYTILFYKSVYTSLFEKYFVNVSILTENIVVTYSLLTQRSFK